MKTYRPFRAILLCLGLCLAAQAARADTFVGQTYVFDELDRLWTATLEQPQPATRWFATLGSGSDGPEPIIDVPTGFLPEVAPAGVIVSEQEPGAANNKRHGFPVIAIARDDIPVIYQRMALIERYLGRYRSFKRADSDTADQLNLLRRRQNSADVELFLINLTLYFAESTLPAKCKRLERLAKVEANVPPGIKNGDLIAAWQPLLPILTAARARLAIDDLHSIVCAVKPVRSKGETQKLVTDQVHGQIMKRVDVAIAETNSSLKASGEEFKKLVTDMNVEIKSGDVLELERVLGNVQSNLVLVKTDQLKATDTIDKLQKVDLSQLKRKSDNDAFEQAQGTLADMVKLIDAVLEATAQLAIVSDDAAISEELEECRNLGAVYDALDLTRDTASLEAGVLQPYTNCLIQARKVVERFQAPTLDKASAAEFSRNLKQISDAFLTVGD